MKCVDRYTNLRAVQQVFSEAQKPNVRGMTSFVQVASITRLNLFRFRVCYIVRARKSWNEDTSPRRKLHCTSRARPLPWTAGWPSAHNGQTEDVDRQADEVARNRHTPPSDPIGPRNASTPHSNSE